jgi:hypothetical protein
VLSLVSTCAGNSADNGEMARDVADEAAAVARAIAHALVTYAPAEALA